MSSDSRNATNLTAASNSHIFAIYCYKKQYVPSNEYIGCTT